MDNSYQSVLNEERLGRKHDPHRTMYRHTYLDKLHGILIISVTYTIPQQTKSGVAHSTA